MNDATGVGRAEREIDSAFEASPLLDAGYEQAMWTLLSVSEDAFLRYTHELSGESLHIFADSHLNALAYPLRACLKKAQFLNSGVRREMNNDHYGAAWQWLELADDYSQFCSMFPLWHRKRVRLSVSGDRLVVDSAHNNDKTYEAYNRLVRKDAKPDPEIEPPSEALLDLLVSRVTAGDTWFRVKFDTQLVSALEFKLAPMLSSRHSLPENWEFTAFTLAQYRRVMLTLQSMMYGWHLARQLVAQEGMPGVGYPSAVWLVPTKELGARLKQFTGLPKPAINSILDLITFGSNDVREPDIARQPLVDLKDGYFALAPFVFLNLNVEGNLCALLNQIPAERERYLALVDDKEDALVGEIKSDLKELDFEFIRGDVDGTDIDLAIIDRTNRTCLCLELKWFIEPAEIREVEDRTKDLAKGVKQAKQIAALFERGDEDLLRLLKIDRDYVFLSAVGSVNWIGFGDVQDPAVPIIKVRHLVNTLQSNGSLKEAISWLNDRAYLPDPGDYEVRPWEIACGGWKATWYGIFVP